MKLWHYYSHERNLSSVCPDYNEGKSCTVILTAEMCSVVVALSVLNILEEGKNFGTGKRKKQVSKEGDCTRDR